MNSPSKLRLCFKYLLSNFKTDDIEFKVTEKLDYQVDPEGWPWKHTDIIINGKSLFEKLREHEIYEAKRTDTNAFLAGKYVGIDPYHIQKAIKNGNSNMFSIWQCGACYSSSCSAALVCDLKVTPFYVELFNFRQIAKPTPLNNSPLGHPETLEKLKWNYEAFGPFRFKKRVFMKAVRSLKTK